MVMDITKQPNDAVCQNCGAREAMPAEKMNINHWLAIMNDFQKRHEYCVKEEDDENGKNNDPLEE